MFNPYFDIDIELFVYLQLYGETVYINRKDVATIDELSLYIIERTEEPEKYNINKISEKIINKINEIELMSNYDRHILFLGYLTLVRENLENVTY